MAGSFPTNHRDQAKYVRHYTSGRYKKPKKSGTTAKHANNIKSVKSANTYTNKGKAKGVQYTPQGVKNTYNAAHNNAVMNNSKPVGKNNNSRMMDQGVNLSQAIAEEMQRMILGNTVENISNYGTHHIRPSGILGGFFDAGPNGEKRHLFSRGETQDHPISPSTAMGYDWSGSGADTSAIADAARHLHNNNLIWGEENSLVSDAQTGWRKAKKGANWFGDKVHDAWTHEF